MLIWSSSLIPFQPLQFEVSEEFLAFGIVILLEWPEAVLELLHNLKTQLNRGR